MTKTSVAEVLADSQITVNAAGQPRYFSVTFWKDDGSIGSIEKASRNYKGGRPSGSQPPSNMKKNDLLMLFDHLGKTHKNITVSLLKSYNGHKVIH